MSTHGQDPSDRERTILAALCAVDLTPDGRNKILAALADYFWREPDHRVIFEALRRAGGCHRAALRENLISEITRLGFPDVDLNQFFAPCALATPEIESLAHTLLAARRDTSIP